jgi:ATP-dependent RNA helicase DeaD
VAEDGDAKLKQNGKAENVPNNENDQSTTAATDSSGGSPTECKTFQDMGLSERSMQALEHVGYETPSPIQLSFIPRALTGRDCTGQAHTGTGKTAAFVLPILEAIDHDVPYTQALILAPTRELADQVKCEAERLAYTSPIRVACFVGQRDIDRQIRQLERGVQVAVGTPGRVKDLNNRGHLVFDNLRVVVLDEADRMLDIGFEPEIRDILRRCPTDRQTLLLSATLPPSVERLAKKYMTNAERVDLSGDAIAVDSIDQFYCTVDPDRKFGLLVRLLSEQKPNQVIVFTRTKRGADSLYRRFSGGLANVGVMHGDLPQSKRERSLKRFREGQVRLLIATDVAGRGIDVSAISHIVNYDIPEYHDDYIHRIGRTGRMTSAEKGRAFTFVTREQGDELTRIEIRVNKQLTKYTVSEYQAYRDRGPRPTVDTVA